MRSKLEQDQAYMGRLSFSCKLDNAGQYQSCIIYSADIDIDTAVKYSYRLGSMDMIKDAGTALHRSIHNSFKSSDELKWPPSAQDLTNHEVGVPPELEKFLSYVIAANLMPKSVW